MNYPSTPRTFKGDLVTLCPPINIIEQQLSIYLNITHCPPRSLASCCHAEALSHVKWCKINFNSNERTSISPTIFLKLTYFRRCLSTRWWAAANISYLIILFKQYQQVGSLRQSPLCNCNYYDFDFVLLSWVPSRWCVRLALGPIDLQWHKCSAKRLRQCTGTHRILWVLHISVAVSMSSNLGAWDTVQVEVLRKVGTYVGFTRRWLSRYLAPSLLM